MSQPVPDLSAPPQRPALWGIAVGLLAASLATVVGVAKGLDPDTIVLRAAIGGSIAALVALLTAVAVQATASVNEGHDGL